MTFTALARDPTTPDAALYAAVDEILTHSVRHPYEDVLLARMIRSALAHNMENAK